MQKCSKICDNKAKYCQKYQSFETDVPNTCTLERGDEGVAIGYYFVLVLFVYFDGEQVAEPTLMGKLMGTRVRGKVLYSM